MISETLPYAIGLSAYIIFIMVRIFKVILLKKARYPLERSIFILATFIYFSGVVSVTLFPIPVDARLIADNISGGFEEQNNYIPLNSIIEILSTGFETIILTQLGGNLILLFPLGCLMPLLSKFNTLKRNLLLGFLVSIVIELFQVVISQLIGFTYRSVDIDDIFLNTLGTGMGYIAYKYLYLNLKEYYLA
ncbi:VanZ family protein [Bacillus gobiensis]|uniref:VanZ family protein n=1 Tax=Bacillus gobiensis TaxID=1441095 RepID=UPI003D1A3C26